MKFAALSCYFGKLWHSDNRSKLVAFKRSEDFCAICVKQGSMQRNVGQSGSNEYLLKSRLARHPSDFKLIMSRVLSSLHLEKAL